MKISNFYKISILAMISFSCVSNYTGKSPSHDLTIDFKYNNAKLDSKSTSVIAGSVSNNEEYVKIKFNPVRGGGKIFLGYSYDRKHGDDYKDRLKITCDSTIVGFSVNEILAWPSKMTGAKKIYIAPKICSD